MNEFFHALKNKRARREFLKSVVIGAVGGLLDFMIVAVILYAEGHKYYENFFSVFHGNTISCEPHKPPSSTYLTANLLGFIVSFVFNYVMCCFFVYEYGNVGRNKKGLLKCILFAAIGLGITTLGSLIGYAIMPGQVWIIKIVITILVALFNFFTRKYFVFNIALIRDDENTIQL